MLALSARGWAVWRQNVGLAWAGDVKKLGPGRVLIENARPLHCGLCKGSSDIIGIRPVVITQEMVGSTIGGFGAVEVKTLRGRISQEQQWFLDSVTKHGGWSGVIRSLEDLEKI
jgi:hypothetical protein